MCWLTGSATQSSSTRWTSRWRKGTLVSIPSTRVPSCGPSSSNPTLTSSHSMTRWTCAFGISGSTRPSNSSTAKRYSSTPAGFKLFLSCFRCSFARRKLLSFGLLLLKRNQKRSTNSTIFSISNSAQWPTKFLYSLPTMYECITSLLVHWRNCSPNCTSPIVRLTLQHASSGLNAEDFL